MSLDSCLAEAFSHYIELQSCERAHLARFEETEKHYPKQVDIHTEGESAASLHVVKKGWLYSYTDFADGRRQIVKVHVPGDVVGFADLAYPTATTTLRTCADATVCPFPKEALDEVMQRAPRLSALLLTIALRDQVILVDTLKAMGRMSARERVAYFLLDLQARLRVLNGPDLTGYALPLSQTEIGDIIGLTNVYVSKTLGRLEEAGRIKRENGRIEIVEEDDLRAMVGFVDRYATLDTDWFQTSAIARD